MAKKKIVKKKKVSTKAKTKVDKGINIEFHSWTFFAFLLFVLLAAMMLLMQQQGMHFLRMF